MNRLVLLGNGFDLAHGMKTSYNDFMVWYLSNAMEIAKEQSKYSDGVISVARTGSEIMHHYCKNIVEYVEYFYNRGSLQPLLEPEMISYDGNTRYSIPFKVTVHSKFMSNLLTKFSFKNWVDIENEYYSSLKSLLQLEDNKKRNDQLQVLNTTLNVLITNLGVYLEKLKPTHFDDQYLEILAHPIEQNDFVDWPGVKKKSLTKTLVLNFNYTSIIERYLDPKDDVDVEINYIHGRLGHKENPLVFGFGDELDENYKKLESDKTPGFFRHIKSFWYFKTRNYHDFLRFVDSGQFQVFILGHSCGLSDRTMLNLIFEHKNCMSIKIFYYAESEGKNNYTELTEEISRHFTSKSEMRKKIVPFPFCKKMPQID